MQNQVPRRKFQQQLWDKGTALSHCLWIYLNTFLGLAACHAPCNAFSICPDLRALHSRSRSPSEFIRRNNNQCMSLGCWGSRSILQLSVCWNSRWHKCSLLWLRTRRTHQNFPSLFYWNVRERILFGDCITPLLWGQVAAQSQFSIWDFRRWCWRCWNTPALITDYHLMII